MSGNENKDGDFVMREFGSDSGSEDEGSERGAMFVDETQYVVDQDPPVDSAVKPEYKAEVHAEDILVIEHLSEGSSQETGTSETRENEHITLEFPDDPDKNGKVKYFPASQKRSSGNLPKTSIKKFRQSTLNTGNTSTRKSNSLKPMSEESNDNIHLTSLLNITNVDDHHSAHRLIAIECNANNNLNSEKRSYDRKRKTPNRARKSKEHNTKPDETKIPIPVKKSKLKDLTESSDGAFADTEDNAQLSSIVPKGLLRNPKDVALDGTLSNIQKPCDDHTHAFCDCPTDTSSRKSTTSVKPEKKAQTNSAANVDSVLMGRASSSKGHTLKIKSVASGKAKRKCLVCKKKLGLTAIKCRCGGIFCSKHRYDKEHDCTFDYKAMGADEIRKNNPLVVAEKVTKL